MLGTSLKPLTAPAFMIARQIMPCRYGHWVGRVMLGDGCLRRKMLDSQPHQTIGYCKTSRHSPQTHTSSKWLTANTVFGSNPLNAKNNPLVQLLKAEKLWGLKSAEVCTTTSIQAGTCGASVFPAAYLEL